jgi:hypothetical protein
MSGPSTAPCQPWATWEQAVLCHNNAPNLEAAQRASVMLRATAILSRLSINAGAPAYGLCEHIVRPCRSCYCGGCNTCDCTPYYEIELTNEPIAEVIEVRVDGVIFEDWQLDNWGQLVRTDGQPWPYCQNKIGAATDTGVFSVKYSVGLEPPEDAVAVAAEFGYQLALADCGDTRCVLPQRVKSIVREGVTMTLIDKMDFLSTGGTGVYEIDLWLSSFKSRSAGGGLMHAGMRFRNRVSQTSVP